MSTPDREHDAPVTVATFPHPHEAELARSVLESQGIHAVVQSDHGQYVTFAPWVQLQVAQHDRDAASVILEGGPLATSGAESAETPDEGDDLRPVRLKRRFVLARWFLYASALLFVLTVWVTGPLFAIPLGLALWSRVDPRRAFASAFFFQVVVLCVSVLANGLLGLGSAIPLLAYYWAWTSAGSVPPDQLLASPFPRTPTIEIGRAWQQGDASGETVEYPIWILRDLGVFALVVLSVWVIRQAIIIG